VSQTIGPDRGLECAVAAIALARSKPHLYLRGSPAAGFGETLGALAAKHGVAGHVHLLEPAAPHLMEALASGYDVGLVAETGGTLNRSIALPNKPFTYFLAGLPALMSDTPGHRAFADEARGAVRLFTVQSALSLAQAMDDLFEDPDWLARARAEAFRLGQERYNWEIEQARLLACVEAALAGKPA
jgi:glycosyltransferase involved in cell wall biosynthesis